MQLQKRCLILFLSILLLFSMSVTARADEALDTSKRGSVTVIMKYKNNAVPGGTLALHRVGIVCEDGSDYGFELTKDFMDCGESLEELSAELAESLAEYAKNNKLQGTTENISNEGKVTFEKLELGLYLIVQNEAASGFERINPFFVSVPLIEEGKPVYDVDATSKMEPLKRFTPNDTDDPPDIPPDDPLDNPPDNLPDDPNNPDDPDNPSTLGDPNTPSEPDVPGEPKLPQTGQLNWPVPVMVILGVLLFSIGWVMRFGKKKD